MAYINQPPDLRILFSDLDTRLKKLETAQRFTSPDVTTDPTNPRTGDLWYNNTQALLKLYTGAVNVALVTTGLAQTFTALQTFSAGLTVSGGTLTATAVTSNLGTLNSGTTGTGALTASTVTSQGQITGQVGGVNVIAMSNDANGSIELGKVNGSTSTPFIDFHSGATAVDFDARIIGSGGTGSSGGGALEINSNRLTLTNVNVNLASIATATTIGANGAASALTANPVGYIIIEIGGTQRKIPYYNV